MTWMSYCYTIRSLLTDTSFHFPKAVAMVTVGSETVTDAVRMIMWPVSEKMKAAFGWFSCCIIKNQYFQKQITIYDNHILTLIPYNNPRQSD